MIFNNHVALALVPHMEALVSHREALVPIRDTKA